MKTFSQSKPFYKTTLPIKAFLSAVEGLKLVSAHSYISLLCVCVCVCVRACVHAYVCACMRVCVVCAHNWAVHLLIFEIPINFLLLSINNNVHCTCWNEKKDGGTKPGIHCHLSLTAHVIHPPADLVREVPECLAVCAEPLPWHLWAEPWSQSGVKWYFEQRWGYRIPETANFVS